MSSHQDWLDGVVKTFAGGTVGAALFTLGGELRDGLIDEPHHDTFMSWVLEKGYGPMSMIEAPKMERPTPPVKEKLHVGHFNRSYYEGESERVHLGNNLQADCQTKVWMDDDGYLVFEDPESDASAVVNMDTLIERARRLRDQHHERYEAYLNDMRTYEEHEKRQEPTRVIFECEGDDCGRDVYIDSVSNVIRNADNNLVHACRSC